jgi:alginate O-acetyltransferase complex protein AlgJ
MMPADRLLIGAFLVALALPAGLGLCRGGDWSFPELKTWRTWPGQCEEWFTARLAGRLSLRKAHGLLKVQGLGVSAARDVILGRDGWLFLDETHQYGRGRPAPDPHRQAELWRQSLSQRHDWLAARGVRYLVVIVPEKSSVYPEFLPPAHRRPVGPTAADLLTDGPDFPLLNLDPVLRAAKRAGPVYFRTDTHWNATGGAAALGAIVPQMQRWCPAVPPAGASLTAECRFRRGDLARLLGLNGWLSEPAPVALSPRSARLVKEPSVARPELRDPPDFQPQLWATDRPELPAVILFHDSFGDALIPGLADCCRRLICLPTWSFDTTAIEHYRPQLVIQEIAERALTWRLPPDPVELGGRF